MAGNARIMGIDPGSRTTGVAIIDTTQQQSTVVHYQPVRCGSGDLPERLKVIFETVSELIGRHRPDEFAIENVFMATNAASALKLGQARGAAICAAVAHHLPVYEYAPKAIKQAVVGKGGAAKNQVQFMVGLLLGIKGDIQEDSADALAVALCHANTRWAVSQLNLGSSYYRHNRAGTRRR